MIPNDTRLTLWQKLLLARELLELSVKIKETNLIYVTDAFFSKLLGPKELRVPAK